MVGYGKNVDSQGISAPSQRRYLHLCSAVAWPNISQTALAATGRSDIAVDMVVMPNGVARSVSITLAVVHRPELIWNRPVTMASLGSNFIPLRQSSVGEGNPANFPSRMAVFGLLMS